MPEKRSATDGLPRYERSGRLLLPRKIRERELSRENANHVLTEFQSHLNQSLFKRIPLERHHYSVAFNWLAQFAVPLRTLDALHLAVAAQNNLELITADQRLLQSARKLGVRSRLLR
ncbi:MAG: type II toxin-antitoxin system VapC family toxin [Deltaproteobacteria bacterium]|nr:type II toxin-antitoxin system VapC family toxin [Deltaproteobacteria bacterium]